MSLWWRWLAAEGDGEKVPQLWAGETLEQELRLGSGLELGSRSQQEKWEQLCGSQRYSGLHHHLHWLPERVAGLMWLSVSGKRIQRRENTNEMLRGKLHSFIHYVNTVDSRPFLLFYPLSFNI